MPSSIIRRFISQTQVNLRIIDEDGEEPDESKVQDNNLNKRTEEDNKETIEEFQWEQRRWRWQNKRAVDAILKGMEQSLCGCVEDMTKASDMWASLQNHYQPTGFTGRTELLTEFRNATLTDQLEAMNYTHQIRPLGIELEKFFGCTLPAEVIADKLISGLGPEFEGFRVKTLQSLDKGDIHILGIRDLIEEECIRRWKEKEAPNDEILAQLWELPLVPHYRGVIFTKERRKKQQRPLDCDLCKRRDRVSKNRSRRALAQVKINAKAKTRRSQRYLNRYWNQSKRRRLRINDC